MTDTKELLARIAALKERLGTNSGSATGHPHRSLDEKVQRGAMHNTLIDSTLRSGDPGQPALMPTVRLTARGARLLRQGKDLLQTLRAIANDTEYEQADEPDPIRQMHREGMAMLEVVLRTVQAMPTSVSGQLRMCDGLEIVLTEVRQRVDGLQLVLAQRRRTTARIDDLADYLRCLAGQRPVSLASLQAMADAILDEAKAGQPLRFLYASPADPSRFAAAHSLTVAQVLARVLLDDAEWQSQLPLALSAALVHDVGMTRVPAEVLLKLGPLGTDERRLIEKHTSVAQGMLTSLWPGGGWPVEAATCHHERNDGTGYPLGHTEIQLAGFVRLLAVCDVYSALCCPRPHRTAFDTRTALTETLLLAEREYLDKSCAERLLRLSFYPVGSKVELNDGANGVVIAVHAGEAGITHPDRPIVYLTTDDHGQPLDWPTIVDLLKHTDRSILRAI